MSVVSCSFLVKLRSPHHFESTLNPVGAKSRDQKYIDHLEKHLMVFKLRGYGKGRALNGIIAA